MNGRTDGLSREERIQRAAERFTPDLVNRHRAGTDRLLFHLSAIERMTAEDGGRGALEDSFQQLVDEALPVRASAAREVLSQAQPARPRPPLREDGTITCVLADDHPIVTESIAQVLVRSGVDLLGRAVDGEKAVEEIVRLRPSVALVDLRLPVLDGAEVARRCAREAPETAVILYTGADPVLLSGALESGARGFLLKEAPISDLARAVRMVAQGGIYLDPALAGFLMDSPARHDLTRQELEILRLLAEGCTNEQVGKRLFLSPETVRTHVRKLMAKLNVHTRTEAVATALRERLIA